MNTIETSARRRQIQRVYHFTPLAQVSSILEHGGIHPRTVLRARGISFNDDPNRWSNNQKKAEELASYVAVSIARPWGMMQNEPQCVVFGIDPCQLWREHTAFLGAWSSENTIRGISDVEAREGIEHFDAMFDNEHAQWPAELPGEILVRGSIGLEDILRLYVRDEDHERSLRRAVEAAKIRYSGPTIRLEQASWIFGVR